MTTLKIFAPTRNYLLPKHAETTLSDLINCVPENQAFLDLWIVKFPLLAWRGIGEPQPDTYYHIRIRRYGI